MPTMGRLCSKARAASGSKRCHGRAPAPEKRSFALPRGPFVAKDVHIVRSEYPVQAGLILGHEPVGSLSSATSATGC